MRMKKMSSRWNEEQKKAIEHNKGNCLVSASAGSGKTAVLTERVYRLIKEHVELDQFLILTFTNLAASSMKEKIRDKLMKDGESSLAALLDAVSIMTFDAFALSLVKKYYYRLGLREDIKLVDSSILELEHHKIVRKIFDEQYENHNEQFLKFVEAFAVKDDEALIDFVLAVSNKADLKYDKQTELYRYQEYFTSPAVIDAFVDALLEDLKEIVSKNHSLSKSISVITLADKLVEYYEMLMSLNTYEEFYQFFNNSQISYPRKVSSLDEDEKALFDSMKDELMSYKEFFKYENRQEIYTREERKKEHIKVINAIILEADKRLDAFKRKYNSYDFKDIFKFALDLVNMEDIANELKNKFEYIMIDEYQDTSDLQEEFISKIANDNVFMVGDIKQSIYRFRNADPTIFLDKFDRYGKGDGGKRIDLPKNYRSSDEVIGLVNEIFAPLLTKETSNIDYAKEHIMVAGAGNANKGKSNIPVLDNEVIFYENEENEAPDVKEARIVASDIIRRIESKEEVYDKDKKIFRPISYSDFAILSYASSSFLTYQKIFEEYSIPLFANYRKKMHESDITLILENIIKCVELIRNGDSLEELKHPFMSVLRSAFVAKKDDYIDDIFMRNLIEEDGTYLLLKEISFNAEKKLLTEIFNEIIAKFDVYEKIIKLGDVSLNLELLDHYFEIIKNMDNMEYTLNDLVEYFDQLKEYEIEPEYDASKGIDDAVKLMTIHASKGLEFKYVYIVQTYRKFNFMDSRGTYLVSSSFGIDIPDLSYPVIENYTHQLIKEEDVQESILEQIRVFYVALTRAEEKLIILRRINKQTEKKVDDVLSSKGFYNFLNFSEYQIQPTSYALTEKNDEVKEPEKKRPIKINKKIELSDEIIKKVRASKESLESIDVELLELGTKFHYYLELVDFSAKDTSFILDKHDREIISSFLKNDLFNQPGLKKVLHEYSFYDEETNINGVIDLMLIYNDHIDIVDFKLSNIDDANYDRQVNIYKDYVKKITDKNINLYVVGILSRKIREIK